MFRRSPTLTEGCMRHQSTTTLPRVVVLAFAAIILFYSGVFLISWRLYSVGEPGGFAAFYSTIQLVHSQGIGHMYDPSLQAAFHSDAVSRHAYWYHLSYEMLLLYPLGFLSRPIAFLIWTSLNVASVIAGTCLFLARYVWLERWELLLWVGAFSPVLAMCTNGQDSGLLFLAFALALDQWMKGRDFTSGAAVALALFKFQYALFVLLILGWNHRRMLMGFTSTAVPLVGISFWLVGTQGARGFFALVRMDRYETGVMMANIRGLVYAGFGRDVLWCTLLCSGLLYLYVIWSTARSRDRLGAFAVAVLAAWLLSYHGHLYDAVLLFIPIAIAMQRLRWPVILVLISFLWTLFPFQIFWVAIPILYLMVTIDPTVQIRVRRKA
jgi:Glycosyltransferase family 87